MKTKLVALFGVPTAIVSALLLTEVVGSEVAGGITLVLGATQTAVAAYIDPAVPWVGRSE